MTEEIIDPDKCHLSKAQLMQIGKNLIVGWERVKRPHYKEMQMIAKFGMWYVNRQKPDLIEQYYKDFFKEVFELMKQNAIATDPSGALAKWEAKRAEMRSHEEQPHTELPSLEDGINNLWRHKG